MGPWPEAPVSAAASILSLPEGAVVSLLVVLLLGPSPLHATGFLLERERIAVVVFIYLLRRLISASGSCFSLLFPSSGLGPSPGYPPPDSWDFLRGTLLWGTPLLGPCCLYP